MPRTDRTNPFTTRRRRRRSRVLLVLAAVVLAGLVVATRVPDPLGDVGGDVLYAVAAYVLVVLVLSRVRPLAAAGIALAWCWVVEALQATGVAAAVNDAVPPAAWAARQHVRGAGPGLLSRGRGGRVRGRRVGRYSPASNDRLTEFMQ